MPDVGLRSKIRVTLAMPHPGYIDGVHSDKQLQPLRQSDWGKKRKKKKREIKMD